MSDIGIIIVTYNSVSVIDSCLTAALASGADVIVVDNASTDGTPQAAERPGVRLIVNSTNRGFAGAVNQGFSLLNCTYILLLNPDAVLQTGLEALREASSLPRAAGAGGQLLDPQGIPQIGFMVRKFPTPAVLSLESLLLNRIWPRNPANLVYRGLDLDYSRLQAVDQPAGAFLMIRRAVWEELGGFDERFRPLWFEDVDFCRRAADRGYLWYYTPQSVAKHTGGHSIVKLALEMRRVYWYRGLLRYCAKHFRPLGFRTVCLAVVVGSLLRVVIEFARQRNRKSAAGFGEVVGLAFRLILGREDDIVSPAWRS
ncbi:MAG: glycosyltransferase [Acidobacteriia bacterium]|nr:glycosyltransferase [Terriglobia bacterium]